MKYGLAFAALIASAAIAPAQSETNQIMGRLGYPVGTELTIEGAFGGGKDRWISVTKVNGTNLIPNVTIESNLVHPSRTLETRTNIIFRLKGCEGSFVVPDQDPGQQQIPGRRFFFAVSEVLSPSIVGIHRSSNRPSVAIGADAPQQQR